MLLGLEVDFFPDTVEAVVEMLEPYPFDVLIASTHWLGAWGFDIHDLVHEFDRTGVEGAYDEYFEVEKQLAASGHFDVLAHADVIKKQGPTLPAPPLDHYEELAIAASRGGMAVEVSTAGLHQPIGEMYPAPALLERFHRHGVPITISSDAHLPQHCGRDRDQAIELARSVGYTQRIAFRNRVGRLVPLT